MAGEGREHMPHFKPSGHEHAHAINARTRTSVKTRVSSDTHKFSLTTTTGD